MQFKVEWTDSYVDASKNKFEALDWEEVQKYHPLAPVEKPKDIWNLNYALDNPTRLNDEEILNLQRLGFKIEVVPYPGAMITKMQDRHEWEYGEHVRPSDILDGRAVQVSIPDMAILLINEVKVCEDCCTDALQGEIEDGWRILAVCPPNAQRRPDYVLGRVKPKGDR